MGETKVAADTRLDSAQSHKKQVHVATCTGTRTTWQKSDSGSVQRTGTIPYLVPCTCT